MESSIPKAVSHLPALETDELDIGRLQQALKAWSRANLEEKKLR